jgi:alkylation response protein AidB-like acyl-CoA dehydrogenase
MTAASASSERATVPALALAPSHEEQMLRETVFGITADFGPSYYQRVNSEERSPTELWHALGEAGYLGVHLPEQYGGGGLGLQELTAVLEETAAAGCPLLRLLVPPGFVGTILARHGSQEQKQRWLPGIASAELRFSFALTEPDAGSNSHSISTVARRAGAGYRISGLARDDPQLRLRADARVAPAPTEAH